MTDAAEKKVVFQEPPCVLAQGCLYYRQFTQANPIPIFWKVMALFHAVVVVVFAVTLFLIATSINTNIVAERATREAALKAAGDNRVAVIGAVKEVLDTVVGHKQMTMDNRTVTAEIRGILLGKATPEKPSKTKP